MLFDVGTATKAWKRLRGTAPGFRGKGANAWIVLRRYLRRHGQPDADDGMMGVVALFGERAATSGTDDTISVETYAGRYTITSDPEQGYLLSQVSRLVLEDEELYRSIRETVIIRHAPDSYAPAEPELSLLHRYMERDLALAEQNRDEEGQAWLRKLVQLVQAVQSMEDPVLRNELEAALAREMRTRDFVISDDNIADIRARYPDGLHFVVGDLHGAAETMKALMEKIGFDPSRDHVYCVGDYNAGGSPRYLMSFIAPYYQQDHELPGIHLIRGNHERELWPDFPLENMPDIIVYRGRALNYHIVHAGMVAGAFELITEDMRADPDRRTYAYRLDDSCARDGAPFREVIWSKGGLYVPQKRNRIWPKEDRLKEERACIIHGHTPYCFLKSDNHYSYGGRNLFWTKQHMWFSEDLQAFDIDSDIKGRNVGGETYRGLSCICLEVLDETVAQNGGCLSIEALRSAPNMVFSVPKVEIWGGIRDADHGRILKARPEMKTIRLDHTGRAIVE